jgi:ATP phosphoribosyltransferase
MNPIDRPEPGAAAAASPVRLALPKGRMEAGVLRLLAEAGIHVHAEARGYRPRLSAGPFETKQLKPQNIVGMLAAGSRDVGFAGADWVAEKGVDLVELLDTGLDPVRIVVAAPRTLPVESGCPRRTDGRPLVVASEYERLARTWMQRCAPDATFLRSHGATEVFPPEDADVVVDNTATGSTLAANGLCELAEVFVW